LWTIGLWTNPRLLVAVVLAVAAQLALTYHPVLQGFFHTTALTGREVAVCVAVASTVSVAVEMEKWWNRRRETIRLNRDPRL
jgi:magnesium-transporting ATPase (P-type)